VLGVDKEEIWECLRTDDGPQGNAVKVAYTLLWDKRRLGRDCKPITSFMHVRITDCVVVVEFAEAEQDSQLAARDVGFIIRSQCWPYT
jgi:carbon catabolite-derepressing protein kinase